MSDSLTHFEKSKKLFIALGDYKADDIVVQREHMKLRYALARAYAQNGDARWQENIAASGKLAERVASLKGAGPRDRSNVAGMLAEQANLAHIFFAQAPDVEALINKVVTMQEALLREMPGERVVRDNLAGIYERAANIFGDSQRAPQKLAHAIEMRGKGNGVICGACTRTSE